MHINYGNNNGSRNRKLLRVHIEDAIEADQVFEDLMGEKVEPRKSLLMKTPSL